MQIFQVHIFIAMGNINFKISFNISKPVNINIIILRTKILEELKNDGYEVIINNDMNIEFNNYGEPLFRAKGASSSKLREGKFTLIEKNDNTLVRLNYNIPFLSLLFAFIVLLLLGFLWGWEVLFIIGFLIAGFISELVKQKNNAKQLLDSITDSQ